MEPSAGPAAAPSGGVFVVGFGEAALRLGLISEADIQYALSRQFAYAYLRKTPGEKKPVSDELVAARRRQLGDAASHLAIRVHA